MTITKTYKYKLKPNLVQRTKFAQYLGVCRLLYNLGLETKIHAYESNRINVSKFELMQQIKDLNLEFDWIKDVQSQVKQDVFKRLDKTYDNFFRGLKTGQKVGFPKFAKRDVYKSFTFPASVKFQNGKIKLPKIGLVSFFKDRLIPQDAKIKTTTIKKQADGWFACITVEEQNLFIPGAKNQDVGIDMGIAYFAVTSDGIFYHNPRPLKQHQKKMHLLQKEMDRRKEIKGANYQKTKTKIAKLHLKIANTRKNYLHKVSSELVKEYGTIHVENLNLKGMTKSSKGTAENHGSMVKQKSGLNRSLLDVGIGHFFGMLAYKLDWRNGQLVKVNPRNTSRRCSCCGHISKNNRKTQSKFECEICGHTAHADENASQNIMGSGRALVANVVHLARA